MSKKNIKNKGIFKGFVFGVAMMLCGSFVPVGAINALAKTIYQDSNPSKGTGEVAQGTNRIEVDASEVETTVAKGGNFNIPTGLYFGKTNEPYTIGSGTTESITESKVVAYYDADGSVVYDSSQPEKYPKATFGADRIGKYIVEYSVTENGLTYNYKLELKCIVNDVTFEFKTNDSNIIPSVYDLSISKGEDGKNRDIILPIPSVLSEDGDKKENITVILDGEEAPAENKDYMQISIDQAYSEDVKIARNESGDYYISGESLKNANGYEFKIVYKFFQNGVQIASTDKTFSVEDKYYTNSENKAGYKLTASFSTSQPSSATVKVAKALPSITATTSSTDSPANETVSVSYIINVYKRNNSGWDIVKDAVDEDNNFIAPTAGDYKIEYVITDFYGQSVTKEILLNDVKDTVSATPYIYDAADETAKYNKETESYKSAESYLKSKTINRNIVMYAIGGYDNAVDEKDLTLTREIRTGTGSLFYQISDYNDYNLIFNAKAKDSSTVYKTIYDDNFHIREQMILGGETKNDDETIKNWLINNKYLIVTNSRTVDPISGEEYGAELNNEQLFEKGYVFIEPSNPNLSFSAQSYTFYYIANDNVSGNNAKQVPYTVEVVESTDDMAVPSILYSTEFQSSYLKDDTIKLTAPTASDEGGDSRVTLVNAYRYLDSSRNPITSVGQDISYLINSASKIGISSSKWYIQDVNGVVTSSGWTILEGKSEYEIKLKNKPKGAAYIEFFSYAIDDEGNVGFYDKQIYVSDIQDNFAPYLYQVDEVDKPEGYVTNETIVLPTLYFDDNMPQYMNAGVVVYKVDKEGNQTVVHSSNMSTRYDTIRGTYVVSAGSFNAATGGDYLVAVTVTDAGNHSITTYFTYDVASVTVVESPEITNISTENKEIVIGEEQILPVPKLSVSDNENVGYIGISEYDSETTSDYYNISVISADNTDYNLNGNVFVANSRGTYKLQYNVFVISYSTQEESFSTLEGGENGKLFLTTASENISNKILAYKAKGTESITNAEGKPAKATAGDVYYIYADQTETGDYVLKINSSVKGTGAEMDIDQLPAALAVQLHPMVSDIITYTAGEVAVNLNMDSSAYQKTKYEDTSSSIIVKPIDAEVSGSGSIDKDKSNVSISVSSGSTVKTIATVSINDWNNVTDNSDIYNDEDGNLILNLNTNGKYTIKYTVKAKDGMGATVGSEKTISYELSVGDVISPDIEIDNTNNEFIKTTYNVGDVLDIRIDKIVVSDNITTDRNTLLKNIVIQVKNTSDNTTTRLDNTSDVAGDYAYSYKIEKEGSYTVSIYVKDEAGNKSSTKEFTFTVGDDESNPINVTEVVGKVLIGISVAILAGVVVYFVVSKVKENKGSKKSK